MVQDGDRPGTGSDWEIFRNLNVGYYGTGTLMIANGGTVANQSAYVGYTGGATGTVTVDGAGSTWTSGGSLFLGGVEPFNGRNGTLNVTNGGAVSVAGDTELRPPRFPPARSISAPTAER